MTINELDEIVALTDLEQIRAALAARGYRHASKNGVWEFNPIAIAKAESVENTERYERRFTDLVFCGDLHTEVKEYPDTEFIVITVNRIYPQANDREIPCKMDLYTDAPIDEAYEKEQSKIERCAFCKKQFPGRELCEINGKLVCDDCFEKDLNLLKEKGKSRLIKKRTTRK